MDALFFALLTLYFSQGVWRQRHPAARAIGLILLGVVMVAFLRILR